jgi:hypothetical protein
VYLISRPNFLGNIFNYKIFSKVKNEILDALVKTDLLDSLKSRKQNVTLEELIEKLVEISQSPSNTEKLREALKGIHFDFLQFLFEETK